MEHFEVQNRSSKSKPSFHLTNIRFSTIFSVNMRSKKSEIRVRNCSANDALPRVGTCRKHRPCRVETHFAHAVPCADSKANRRRMRVKNGLRNCTAENCIRIQFSDDFGTRNGAQKDKKIIKKSSRNFACKNYAKKSQERWPTAANRSGPAECAGPAEGGEVNLQRGFAGDLRDLRDDGSRLGRRRVRRI